ncbi:hypothetical protein ACFWP5_43155 [Streptomyces sp. NPDC058469]|uniref:hypothetical protein n=1 Tax=Streptomyces sp. NPDC058469 TaxID=3346514 RepID=UPI00366889F5
MNLGYWLSAVLFALATADSGTASETALRLLAERTSPGRAAHQGPDGMRRPGFVEAAG